MAFTKYSPFLREDYDMTHYLNLKNSHFNMKILLIDNNDSFTYNLFHLIKSTCKPDDIIEVCTINRLSMSMAENFDRIIISPGPGIPSEVEILGKIIDKYGAHIPILGVCLGHQAIAQTYGANIKNMENPVHGVKSKIHILNDNRLFYGVEAKTITAGRYHSWCVSEKNMPACLEVTAVDDEGCIMALSHRHYNVHGVQFHPESYMTEHGEIVIHNFLNGR